MMNAKEMKAYLLSELKEERSKMLQGLPCVLAQLLRVGQKAQARIGLAQAARAPALQRGDLHRGGLAAHQHLQTLLEGLHP